MKLIIKNPKTNVANFFRRAGYHFLRKVGEEMVFAKRLTDQPFPRFHAFCKVGKDKFIINLHLDHKKASYEGQRKHSGEYGEGSELLREEAKRLKLVDGS